MRPAKRFYTDVGVEEGPEGFRVTLDGRAIKTPAGGSLTLPGRPLAEAVAAEWAAQKEKIRPHTMPLFRLCATALDRVCPDRQAVIDGVVSYAPTELVCYRATEPPELVERQEVVWQPLLDWAVEVFGVEFRVTRGIMPVEPAPGLEERLAGSVARLDNFALAGLATATATCGSMIIALALVCGRVGAEAAFEAAMLDELHQAAKWGEDEEAAERRNQLRRQIEAVAAFIELGGFRVSEDLAGIDG